MKEQINELLKENNEHMTITTNIYHTIEDNKRNQNKIHYNQNESKYTLYNKPNNKKDFMNTINAIKTYPRSSNISMENIFIELKSKNKDKTCDTKKRNRNVPSFRNNASTCGLENRKRTFSQGKEECNYCQSEERIYKQIGCYDLNKRDCNFFMQCRKVLNKN